MIGPVLQFQDLQELCAPGHKPRRTKVEGWAKRIGLKFHYDGAGGIWTTVDALNQVLGVQPANDEAHRPQDIL